MNDKHPTHWKAQLKIIMESDNNDAYEELIADVEAIYRIYFVDNEET